MKYRYTSILLAFLGTFAVQAQDTAFTYQGRLADSGRPANGAYDLQFRVFDAAAAGNTVGVAPLTRTLAITDGQFSVQLDFGPGVFTGGPRWLELGVRTNGSAGAFIVQSPRQQVTPTPYAIYAPNAGTSAIAGTVAAANITGVLTPTQLPAGLVTNGATGVSLAGTFQGSGAGLSSVDLRSINANGAILWATNGVYGFASAVQFGIGVAPHGAAAGDVNGDGRPDLVSANYGDNTLAVLTNNGNGGFGLFGTCGVGANPNAVVLADINNDGRPDLVSANLSDGTVTVVMNTGSGFGPGASFPAGSVPRSVIAADFNNDGWMDLATADSSANSLVVLTNNRHGGFAIACTPGTGSQPYGLVAADLNGDGRIDLASANLLADTLTVLTNNGAGGFAVASSPATGSRPFAVAAADVNGDGKMDLVSADAIAATLTVLTNNGRGVFAPSATCAVGSMPVSVAAADVNGDGWPDLACANNYANMLTVLTNNSHGGFAIASTNGVGANPWSVVVTDLNGDGRMDLVAANAGNDSLSVVPGLSPSYSAAFAGNGAALTGLNISNMTGTLPDARLSGNVALLNSNAVFQNTVTAAGFNGNGAGLTNLSLQSSGGWVVTGNSGTTPGTHFLGTRDNKPLEMRAYGFRGYSISYQRNNVFGTRDYTEGMNVLGGYWSNAISSGAVGATIGGGGSEGYATDSKTGEGASFQRINRVDDDYGTVGGGAGNAAAYAATVAGGMSNAATAGVATVSGGSGNTASGYASTVPGGTDNTASGSRSFAAGRRARAANPGAFVWADSQDADFVSSGANQFLIRAAGGVGINTTNITGSFTLAGQQAGDWSTPLSFIQNKNASGNSGPALRLLSAANSPDGVLNVGNTGTGKILALGSSAGEVASVNTSGMMSLKSGLVVDSDSVNSNSLSLGIQFGAGSGEGIFSRRGVSGPDQWGLDLCTLWIPRVTLANNGNVGIGNTSPQARLDIATGAGNVQFTSDVVPCLNVVSNAANPGVLRLRNALEVWPSQDSSRQGKVDVRDADGTPNITLNGSGLATVKVLEVTGGSDVAEPFPLKEPDLEAGSVVVIDEEHPGRLKLSQQAYDTRVAGIISGANGVHPGLSLRQSGVLDQGRNVALTGRVYVKADATEGPIQPGDLLTTAGTPGYAMKVRDHARAQGAVLGKAMSALPSGTGYVLVLVTLQ